MSEARHSTFDATRREFLETAAVAGAAAPAAADYRQSGFAPTGAPRRITENLFVFEDTCQVYVVKSGSKAVLVDFGSGKILDHLSGLGVTEVAAILHTHHHRDQCQGDAKAAARGIPIYVPAHEHNLFAQAEEFWRNRRVFHLYYMRNDFNTLTTDLPSARRLFDYTVFKSAGLEFFILPTPGHTLGSITLCTTLDGKKTAFTGDLIYAPGKIQNLYDTQVNYGGSEGIDLGIYSLERLREWKPQMLCPSHGDPMPDPDAGMQKTVAKLTDYFRFQTGNDPVEANRPYPISRHLVGHHLTTSSFYALISDSGKAMFIDYGAASGAHFGNFERATAVTDRIRFVEHSIDRLKQEYGLKSIDVAIPSHMHDDHMNGFPHLKRKFNTQVWCYENMVDVFQNPRGYNLGCILGEPFKVERSFKHGEKFRWEEFEFEMTHSPGHTEQQMALFVTIDGKRVAFTGDAFFTNPRADGTLRHNLIFRNHVENDSHLKSIRNLIEHDPEMICPGHGKSFPVDRAIMEATEKKFRSQQSFFFDLLPEGDTDFGLDPGWASIYPYQILASPGAPQKLEVRVQNYRKAPLRMEVALVTPAEWRVRPDVLRFTVTPGEVARIPVEIEIPKGWAGAGPRFAIAADVVRDGKYLGQITEAVVDMPDPERWAG